MDKKYVQIELTNDKVINLELYPEIAPISVENFLSLVEKHYYDNVIFHRIMDGFMIQTGGYYIEDMTLKEKEELKPIKGEFSSNGVKNDLSHELGVISMARTSVKDSATSQFFLCAADCKFLDGEYAAFGKTIDKASNDVILEVSKVETGRLSPMFTDFPVEMIGIKTIRELTLEEVEKLDK